jgi:hypothetical protein
MIFNNYTPNRGYLSRKIEEKAQKSGLREKARSHPRLDEDGA